MTDESATERPTAHGVAQAFADESRPGIADQPSRRLWQFVLAAALAIGLAAPAGAAAADRIYWANAGTDSVGSAELISGGNALVLDLGAAPLSSPTGIAIDPATNTIYWCNYIESTIYRADLDGGGEVTAIDTTGATLVNPFSIAIDPDSNSIYWTNISAHSVSRANLDGTGEGRDLASHVSTISYPAGIAIDPATETIYWSNLGANTIGRMSISDDPNPSLLNTGGAPVVGPYGLAIDPPSNSIYWTNYSTNTISRANLDGSGNGSLVNMGAATRDGPGGLAVDREANRLYWSNYGGTAISRTNLDGTGNGSDLDTSAARASFPLGLALLKAPAPTEPPAISGGGKVGEELTCNPATWRPNIPGSFLFRAPREVAYAWTLEGESIPGVTEQSYVPVAPGAHRCRATATNYAGQAVATSEPVTIAGVPAFAVSPASLGFDTVDIDGGPSAAKSLVVSNPGTAALGVAGVSLQGANPDQFSLVNSTCGTPVAAFGGTCEVRVAFDPSSVGSKSATVQYTHGGGGSPSTVALTGTGTGTGPSMSGASGLSQELIRAILTGSPSATEALSFITIFSDVLSVDTRGRIPVAVTCAGPKPCSGVLTVRTAKRVRVGRTAKRVRGGRAKPKRQQLTLASTRYVNLSSGTMATIKVPLKKKARRVVNGLGKVKVAIMATTSNPGTRHLSVKKGVLHARDGSLPGTSRKGSRRR